MKDRGWPRRASIYVRLLSVPRPAKEGHSPITYMRKVSISALRNMQLVTLDLVPSAFPTCVSVHVVWKREMLAEETGKDTSLILATSFD